MLFKKDFLNLMRDGGSTIGDLVTEGLMLTPAIASLGLTATDFAGVTNKYRGTLGKDIDRLQEDVTPTTIGDKMSYDPVDTEYLANQLRALNAATRSALQNMSGGNRANAQAHMLAADRNMTRAVGDLNLKARMQNLQQRQQVSQFNRETNRANMEAINQAKFDNRRARQEIGLRSAVARDEERNRLSKNRASNLQALISSLGEYGTQRSRRKTIGDSSRYGYRPGIGGGVKYDG